MAKLPRGVFCLVVLSVLILKPVVPPLGGQEASRQSSLSDNQHVPETNVPDGFTVTSVGDLIMPRPLSMRKDPGFSRVVSILRSSDVTFGNFEGTALDLRTFKGSDFRRQTQEARGFWQRLVWHTILGKWVSDWSPALTITQRTGGSRA